MQKSPSSTTERVLTLDLADDEDRALAEYGKRILNLLQPSTMPKNDFFIATLDDLLGAVYALSFARHNKPPFQGRSGPIEVHVVVKRAEGVAAGTMRMEGTWLAGFHFNGALFRIAGTYHRGLKLVVGRDELVRDLLKALGPAFSDWKHGELDRVHGEVNKLKHDRRGIFRARRVSWSQAHASVAELLELFERRVAAP